MMLYPLQSRNEETLRWCVGYGKYRNDMRRVAVAHVSRHRVSDKLRNDTGAMTTYIVDGYGKERAVSMLSPQFRHCTY
jgi:hypothetical protein